MIDRLSLRTQIIAVVAVLSVGLVGASSVAIGVIGTDRLRSMITHNLEGAAASVANTLDRGMFERFREIGIMASMPYVRAAAENSDRIHELRSIFETLLSRHSHYAWIGYADTSGVVRAASGGVLEGEVVARYPWFRSGMRGPYAGDVDRAYNLEDALADDGALTPTRYIDMAFPVHNSGGDPIGVIAAYLDWRWAVEVRDAVLTGSAAPEDLEILVLNIAGEVLLGTPDVGPETMFTPMMPIWGRGIVEGEGPDGGFYHHGYALANGYQSYSGPGWTVVARRPAEVALAPVRETRAATVAIAAPIALGGVLFVWLLVGRLVRPLGDITSVAEELGRDPRSGQLPMVGGSREVAGLSLALRSLLRRIGGLESALNQTQVAMERRVAEHTRQMEDDIAALRNLADYDPLLNRMLNRRAFLEAAAPIFESVKSGRSKASVVVFDLDWFKAVNDTYGHAAGDTVLHAVAETAMKTIRQSDLVARFGGEEFTILMPKASVKEARLSAERLRRAIAGHPIQVGDLSLKVTASFGCAALETTDEDVLASLDRADRVLYRAKETGRNKVMAA